MTNISSEKIWCNDCRQLLPADQFAKRAKSVNGYQPRCLGCASRRITKWKSKNKHKELKNAGQLMLFVGGVN